MVDANISLYEQIGGETALRQLVDRFYDAMDTSSDASKVRAIHPADLSNSRDKLFMFLSGWSGGPALYVQTYGHPRLRQRHMPFPIGSIQKQEWLWSIGKALEQSGFDAQLIEHLKGKFTEIANSMQNRVDIDL